ncbi:MAG TPA: hypothetical protein VHB98_10945 [Chloroflexota bacterium]|nr:hypothetical protein [Chloroflexota bacterium]
MQTDVPLKVLTALCAADLLPLLGSPDATVLSVETLELPASATSLDSLLHLRSPQGTEYLNLLEWQGYKDPRFLWRALGYLAWLGQRRAERPIIVTPVYLHPEDDTGEELRATLDGEDLWAVPFRCVRLWEEDAGAAVGSGRLGLAILSPLMRGASADLVRSAATLVLEQIEPSRRQADLLTILGVFAEPFIEPAQFVRMMGRERLMASDLLSLLVEERLAEVRQEYAAEREALERERTAERLAQEKLLRQVLVGTVEDAIAARFPEVPFALVNAIRQVHDPVRLQRLHHAILWAHDKTSVEQALREAAADGAVT